MEELICKLCGGKLLRVWRRTGVCSSCDAKKYFDKQKQIKIRTKIQQEILAPLPVVPSLYTLHVTPIGDHFNLAIKKKENTTYAVSVKEHELENYVAVLSKRFKATIIRHKMI